MSKVIWFSHNFKRSAAACCLHLGSTCVMLHLPPRTNTHTDCRASIHHQTFNMHRCAAAQKQRPDSYMHKHIALKWAPLTDRGEGGAVTQRQGPYTGLHAHCLGIITSNSYAQWFWQAQGWAITAWRRQEWLCWAVTTKWLLLCTSDSHHTDNSPIHTDNHWRKF